MKKSITGHFIFLFTLIFASCSNLFTSQESLPSNTKIHFTGTLCITGALPESLNQVQGDSHAELDSASLSRSALPSITPGLDYYYYVTATQTDGSGTFNINSFNNPSDFDTTNGVTFALELTTGKWNIECGIKKAASSGQVSENDVTVMSDTYPATISTVAPVLNHTFYPKPSQSGSGTVELKISVHSEIPEFGRVTTSCSKSVWAEKVSGPVYDTEEGKWIIQTSNTLASGTYEVAFNFYNTSDILLYSTVQTINVFDNMTTNTWVSDGSGAIADNGTFALSSSLVTSFARTTFYVGQTSAATSKEVTASDITGNGSPYAPFASVTKAAEVIAATGSSSKDYRIYVSGTVTGAQEISSAVNGKANSITIQGYNGLDTNGEPKDALNGTSGNSVTRPLNIKSKVPVTITNLKITGGNIGGNGGGIYIDTGTNVLLGDGVLVTGNTAASGGGIYNAGKLYLYGSAMVGKKTDTVATSTSKGNKATKSGAGIYNQGSLYLGYSSWIDETENTPCELTGGVCGNYNENTANAFGGGIYNKGQIYIASGNVSYNCAHYGAGVCTEGAVAMTGGTIEGNEGDNNYSSGGGIYVYGSNGSFSMSGDAVIKNNRNITYGAGVYILYNSSFEMTGGTIENNTATSTGFGGAVYVHTNAADEYCDFKIGADAYIPYGEKKNDIYMTGWAKIKISSPLTVHSASDPIAITPLNYTEGLPLLEAEGVTLANEVGKFEVVPDGSTKYYIASDGKMYKYKAAAQFTTVPAAGDTAGLATIDDFEKVAEWVDAGNELTGVTLILLTDVTLDSSFTPVGEYHTDYEVNRQGKVRKVFTGGTFDGNNKTITYDNVSFTQNYSGIFSGAINATIQNLNLEGTLNVSADYAGCVIGYAEACTVKNCSSSVTITIENSPYGIGGIIGEAEGSYISGQKCERNCYILDCVNTSSIIADNGSYIGGIVGSASVCVIRNCINKGNISGVKACGGIVGLTTLYGPDDYGSLIENCGNNGNITATSDSFSYEGSVGGIAGGPTADNEEWAPKINNCYSSGTITAQNNKAGGIFGYLTNRCSLSKCYYFNPGQACQNGSPSSGSSKYTNVSSILSDMNSLNNSDSATYRRWKVSGSVLEFE